MRVAVLFSGGKDSTYAAFWALAQGFEPMLLTVRPPEYSMMFHHPNLDATRKQAEAMGLEQVFLETTEEDWRDRLISKLKDMGAEGLVAGAIESEYQRRRLDSVGEELGIPTYAPLWHKGAELMEEMLDHMDIRICAVSAEGLGPELLGEPLRRISGNPPPGIHPFLEGGEGETFVADAPFFSAPIGIIRWETSWDGVRGIAEAVVEEG